MKVDISNHFDELVREMDWGEIVSTIEDLILAESPKVEIEEPLQPLLGGPLPAAAAAAPPLPGSAVVDSNRISVQQMCSLTEGHWGYDHRGTYLQCTEEPYAREVCMRQAAFWEEAPWCRNTFLPHNVYNQEVGCHPGLYGSMNYIPVLQLPGYLQNLRPVGYLNGEVVYEIQPNPCVPPDFSADTILPSGFSQRGGQLRENCPYVKKPLNAFMVFRKEQRPIVMRETNIRDSASVNAIIGQKWKNLTKDEQATYFRAAEKEKTLHALQHPDWTFKNNYGKKKCRSRKNRKATPILP